MIGCTKVKTMPPCHSLDTMIRSQVITFSNRRDTLQTSPCVLDKKDRGSSDTWRIIQSIESPRFTNGKPSWRTDNASPRIIIRNVNIKVPASSLFIGMLHVIRNKNCKFESHSWNYTCPLSRLHELVQFHDAYKANDRTSANSQRPILQSNSINVSKRV